MQHVCGPGFRKPSTPPPSRAGLRARFGAASPKLVAPIQRTSEGGQLRNSHPPKADTIWELGSWKLGIDGNLQTVNSPNCWPLIQHRQWVSLYMSSCSYIHMISKDSSASVTPVLIADSESCAGPHLDLRDTTV